MKKIIYLLIIVLFSTSVYASENKYLSFKTEDEANNIEIFKKGSKSVVFVTNKAVRRNYYSQNAVEVPQGSGTGIVWSKEGLIITNFHVVQNASKVVITLYDHSIHDAEVIGLSPEKDLAVLKISTESELFPMPVGDSGILEVGRKVLAIGNPFGLDTTLTTGVVSALGREINTFYNRKIKNVIQTDAAINPGNSGGPLLNSMGQLIGINTAIIGPNGTNVGIGFAIPVNTVKKIIPILIAYGKLIRPIIGIETVPDNWAKRYDIEGVIVGKVINGYDAEKKGIEGIRVALDRSVKLGDVITEINDIKISNNDDMLSILENYKSGDDIVLHTTKNGKDKIYSIKLSSKDI